MRKHYLNQNIRFGPSKYFMELNSISLFEQLRSKTGVDEREICTLSHPMLLPSFLISNISYNYIAESYSILHYEIIQKSKFLQGHKEEMRVNGNRSSHARKPSMGSCTRSLCECGAHITTSAQNFFHKISYNPLDQRLYTINVIVLQNTFTKLTTKIHTS